MPDAFTGVRAARFGLYIHFPYCLARCPYCDFAITVAKEIPHERYANAILTELDLRLREWPEQRKKPVESVFIGGGTPSLWTPHQLGRVLEGVRSRFLVAPDVEVSLEANPEVADAGRYAAYLKVGVNRLSLGVQSFDSQTLKSLGRAHDGAQAEGAFAMAREAGFQNVSLDLIYGVQSQSVAGAIADAERAATLGADHVSAYALTVDRDVLAVETQLSRALRKGELVLPGDDATVEMAHGITSVLEAAGLRRYETSNFAREGKHSRHNALYWTGGEYLGLGMGSVGLVGDTRTFNLRGAEHYLSTVEEGRAPESSREKLSQHELFEERLAMGLRLSSGVDVSALCEAYGEDSAERLKTAARFVTDGFAQWSGSRLLLTDRGMDIHSEIAARLI